MNTKKLAIGAIVILGVVWLGVSYPKGNSVVDRVVDRTLGAVSTLDGIDVPFVKINGQRTWYGATGFTATSSFLCAVKNPYNATSSIIALSAESTNRGTLAGSEVLYVSTSTHAFGTSTTALISAFAMGTGQFSVELEKNAATTTDSAATNGTGDATLLPGRTARGASNYILGPSEWITWKIATTTGGTFVTYPTGQCSAVIKKV